MGYLVAPFVHPVREHVSVTCVYYEQYRAEENTQTHFLLLSCSGTRFATVRMGS